MLKAKSLDFAGKSEFFRFFLTADGVSAVIQQTLFYYDSKRSCFYRKLRSGAKSRFLKHLRNMVFYRIGRDMEPLCNIRVVISCKQFS